MTTTEQHVSTLSIEKLLALVFSGNTAARHEVTRRQISCGQPIPSICDYLLSALLAAREETQVSQDPGDRDPTSTFACECIAAGYLGQNMRDPERAEAYIRMAADNPNVEAELPESGRAFWKSARFNYRLWRVMKK